LLIETTMSYRRLESFRRERIAQWHRKISRYVDLDPYEADADTCMGWAE